MVSWMSVVVLQGFHATQVGKLSSELFSGGQCILQLLV